MTATLPAHGTCIVAIATSESVVIASDRAISTTQQGKYVSKSNQSKIRKLPNGMYVAAAGLLVNALPGGFDVWKISNQATNANPPIDKVCDEIERQILPKLATTLEMVRADAPKIYRRDYSPGRNALMMLLLSQAPSKDITIIALTFEGIVQADRGIKVTAKRRRWTKEEGDSTFLLGRTDEIRALILKDPDLPYNGPIEKNARELIRIAASYHPTDVSSEADVLFINKSGPSWKQPVGAGP